MTRVPRSEGVDTQNEWDLIVRCRAGSTAAFEPLVRRHEGRALHIAELLLGDADDAADAVQEAFVRAYRSLDGLRPGSDFGAWFRSILRNHCLDRIRSAPRRRNVPLDTRTADRAGLDRTHGIGRDRTGAARTRGARPPRRALAGASRDPHAEGGGGHELRGDRPHHGHTAGHGGEPAVPRPRIALRSAAQSAGLTPGALP
jgi:RNA polymerase sigma factor (sigma-70 family)